MLETTTFNSIGFDVWQSGGGCEAYRKELPDGYILATDEDLSLPKDVAVDPDGNVVAVDEGFDPKLDGTGRFPVPEGHWTFSKVLVGTYDREDNQTSLERFSTISEAVRELAKRLMAS